MTNHLFDGTFVTAVNRNGVKQQIPADWLTTRPDEFRLPPSAQAAATPAVDDTPNATWTVNALKAHATRHGIDLGDATTKAQILDALTTQTPDGDQPTDETPATGDDKES